MANKPSHLDPSVLGTREYWDSHYAADLHDTPDDGPAALDPSELESWFDDVKAPEKILDFLTSSTFPLSPDYGKDTGNVSNASILDLGTGNGSMLFTLRLQGRYHGLAIGVDYSPQSIELARKLARQYSSSVPNPNEIRFEVLDIVHDEPTKQPWWSKIGGFDLVLDKGTFDAISLSPDTLPATGQRICELYPRKVIAMVNPGGFLLITSCNWTEEEVITWFTTGEGVAGQLAMFDTIKYPVFHFGGKKGQGVASVCFRKREVQE